MISLEIVDDILERALGVRLLLLKTKEAFFVLRSERLPLGSEGQVIFHSLVAEVHVLVAP